MKKFIILALTCLSFSIMGCEEREQRPVTADQQQSQQQERLAREITAQTGIPAIKNGRERKMLKMAYELRDQSDYTTYTYTKNGYTGKYRLWCESIGYPIPYSTQYTSPMRPAKYNETSEHGNLALPQADPNGLFSPASADATWVMCKDEKTGKFSIDYVEEKLNTKAHPLPARLLEN